MSCANPTVFGYLREGPLACCELALGALPSPSAEKRPRSSPMAVQVAHHCSCLPSSTCSGISGHRQAVPCELHRAYTNPSLSPPCTPQGSRYWRYQYGAPGCGVPSFLEETEFNYGRFYTAPAGAAGLGPFIRKQTWPRGRMRGRPARHIHVRSGRLFAVLPVDPTHSPEVAGCLDSWSEGDGGKKEWEIRERSTCDLLPRGQACLGLVSRLVWQGQLYPGNGSRCGT